MTDLMERTEQEKQVDERKRLESIWWAGVFIWIGLALAMQYVEILPEVGERASLWPWIFLGVGPWTLAMNLYRATSDAPKPSTWDWVWTAVFLFAALGSFVDIGGQIVGAAALVTIGAIFMSRALRRME